MNETSNFPSQHKICSHDTKEQDFFTSFLFPQKLFSINSHYECRFKGKKERRSVFLFTGFQYAPLDPSWNWNPSGCQVAEDKHSIRNFTELPHVLPWPWETHPHRSDDRQEKFCATGENLFHSLFAPLSRVRVECILHSFVNWQIITYTAVYSLMGHFFKHLMNSNLFWPLQTLLEDPVIWRSSHMYFLD